MPFITLCYHYFVNNVQNTFSFELARHWMKERGISCMALSVEFIYLMHLSMLSRRGGRQGIGRGFDRHSWPVGRAFDRFSCPRGRII